ncbi:hypothetical protein [Actinacidiphila glaucinigra]|uniref:hypothetical protein n=1 Tax=Actinacidiphila glaucinigra TaxID=235986 RepID=UPI003D8B0BC9
MGTFRVRVGGVRASGDLGAVTRCGFHRHDGPGGGRPAGKPREDDAVRPDAAPSRAAQERGDGGGAGVGAHQKDGGGGRTLGGGALDGVREALAEPGQGTGRVVRVRLRGSTTHAARTTTDEEPMLDGPRQAEAGMAPAGGGRPHGCQSVTQYTAMLNFPALLLT